MNCATTFVALWIDAGLNPKEVSIRAGHSSVAFTLDRYGHLYELADDTMDKLDALLGETKTNGDQIGTILEFRDGTNA